MTLLRARCSVFIIRSLQVGAVDSRKGREIPRRDGICRATAFPGPGCYRWRDARAYRIRQRAWRISAVRGPVAVGARMPESSDENRVAFGVQRIFTTSAVLFTGALGPQATPAWPGAPGPGLSPDPQPRFADALSQCGQQSLALPHGRHPALRHPSAPGPQARIGCAEHHRIRLRRWATGARHEARRGGFWSRLPSDGQAAVLRLVA